MQGIIIIHACIVDFKIERMNEKYKLIEPKISIVIKIKGGEDI